MWSKWGTKIEANNTLCTIPGAQEDVSSSVLD